MPRQHKQSAPRAGEGHRSVPRTRAAVETCTFSSPCMGCGASTQSPAPKVVDDPPVKEHPPAAATAASGATPTPAATTPAALAGGSQSEDKAEGKIQSAQRGKATRKAKAEAEKAVGAFGMKMVGEEAHSMDHSRLPPSRPLSSRSQCPRPLRSRPLIPASSRL